MPSFSTLAAALALCDLSLAASRAPSPRTYPKRDTAKTVSLPIFGQNDSVYLANISVGTPPQTVTVQIDTGSSDLWVFSNQDQCSDPDGCQGGHFNPGQSSTFVDIGKGLFNSSYGDGSTATGDYFMDTLVIGSATIHNMTMGIANNAQSSGPLFGIMGLDFIAGEFLTGQTDGDLAYYNLPYWLAEQGLINEPIFSLYLNDIDASTGNLLFGGIDTDQFTGPLAILDVVPDQEEDVEIFDFYTVALTAVGAIDSKGNTASYSSKALPAAVILDSGNTIMNLPSDMVEQIYEQVGAIYDANSQLPYIACSAADSDITMAFQFGGSDGALIGVPIAEMVLPPDGSGTTIGGQIACTFGMTPEDEQFALGDTFMRAAYVVFDPANAQVGMAQAVLGAKNNNVQAFSNVAAPPSSAGTLAETAVGMAVTSGAGIPGSTVVFTSVGQQQSEIPHVTSTHGGSGAVTATAATGIHGGSSIPGIATVAQTHGTAAAAAGSTSKAAAAVLNPPNFSHVLAAAGGSLMLMVCGLGGAALVFAGL